MVPLTRLSKNEVGHLGSISDLTPFAASRRSQITYDGGCPQSSVGGSSARERYTGASNSTCCPSFMRLCATSNGVVGSRPRRARIRTVLNGQRQGGAHESLHLVTVYRARLAARLAAARLVVATAGRTQ